MSLRRRTVLGLGGAATATAEIARRLVTGPRRLAVAPAPVAAARAHRRRFACTRAS